jgi:hypothetical protein
LSMAGESGCEFKLKGVADGQQMTITVPARDGGD